MRTRHRSDRYETMKKTNGKAREIPVRFVGEADSESNGADSSEAPDEKRIVAQATEGADDPAVAESRQRSGPVLSMEDDPEADEIPADGSAVTYTRDLGEALAAAEAQVETLTQEKSGLYDQLLRRQAEFENFRKRAERERGEFYQRTRAELLLELLPVLDNFERALASLENSEGDAEALRHGVELIHKQLKDALTKIGLQPVEAVGRSFDPNVHEAVTTEPTDEHEENTILEEWLTILRRGT